MEKTLILGKIEVSRRRGQQRMRWLDEFEQTPGDSEGQGGECCSLWGRKELDTTERLNNRLFTYTIKRGLKAGTEVHDGRLPKALCGPPPGPIPGCLDDLS